MAKATEKEWARAKALFEAGKSLRDISDTVGIPFKTIDYRSKKEVWQKGVLTQLISDTARVSQEFSTLEVAQQQVVSKEVSFKLMAEEFFNQATMKNCKVMMRKVTEETDIVGHRIAQETLNKGRENILGKLPDSTTNVQINNGAEATPPLVGFRVEATQ
jgi:hypothetical protein